MKSNEGDMHVNKTYNIMKYHSSASSNDWVSLSTPSASPISPLLLLFIKVPSLDYLVLLLAGHTHRGLSFAPQTSSSAPMTPKNLSQGSSSPPTPFPGAHQMFPLLQFHFTGRETEAWKDSHVSMEQSEDQTCFLLRAPSIAGKENPGVKGKGSRTT